MNVDLQDKLAKLLRNQSLHKLQEVIVSQNEDGDYNLFNKFTIVKTNNFNIVAKIDSQIINNFYSMKNAVAWCVFYNLGNLYAADRIIELDRKLNGLETEIMIHQKLFKKAKDEESKIIFFTKLNENKLKKAFHTKQIKILLDESNRLQLKKFKILEKNIKER